MAENKPHPLSSEKAFAEFLDTLSCAGCIHLGDKDKPIHERKCTNVKVLGPSEEFPDGVEANKSWIRQYDINRKLHGMGSRDKDMREFWEREDIKDANLYFVCTEFEKNTNGKG